MYRICFYRYNPIKEGFEFIRSFSADGGYCDKVIEGLKDKKPFYQQYQYDVFNEHNELCFIWHSIDNNLFQEQNILR